MRQQIQKEKQQSGAPVDHADGVQLDYDLEESYLQPFNLSGLKVVENPTTRLPKAEQHVINIEIPATATHPARDVVVLSDLSPEEEWEQLETEQPETVPIHTLQKQKIYPSDYIVQDTKDSTIDRTEIIINQKRTKAVEYKKEQQKQQMQYEAAQQQKNQKVGKKRPKNKK